MASDPTACFLVEVGQKCVWGKKKVIVAATLPYWILRPGAGQKFKIAHSLSKELLQKV